MVLLNNHLETHKKSFPLRISSVNVTKSAGNWGLVAFTEEIHNGRLHFFCAVSGVSETL